MSKIVQLKDQEGVSLYPKVLEEYSTTEQVVGKWLGKPLYRKVFQFTNLPNAQDMTLGDVGTNIDFARIDYGKSYMTWREPFTYSIGRNIWTTEFIINDNKQIAVQGNGDLRAFKVILVVEYTKTTD